MNKRIALDRFPDRWLSISVTIWLTVRPRDVAIDFKALQNAFSNEMLVRCPAITTDRLRICSGFVDCFSSIFGISGANLLGTFAPTNW